MSETSYREQGRAVFLAAMMVLSVVAMSAAFAGATAAQEDVDVDVEIIDVDPAEPSAGDELDVTVAFENNEDDNVTGDVEIIVDDETIFLDEDRTFGEDFAGDIEETYDVSDDDAGEDLEIEASFLGETDTETVSVEEPPAEVADGINYDHVGSVVWQGQDVVAYGELIDDNHDVGDDVELREVDSFGDDDSTFHEELSTALAEDVGADSHDDISSDEVVVPIDTDDLEDEYYFVDSSAMGLGNDFSSSDAFEVSVQDLDVDFDDTTVTDSGPDADTEVEFDSRRGSYHVNASADGDLDAEELFAIFTTDEADASGFDDYDTIGDAIDDDDDIGDRQDFAAAVYNEGYYIGVDEDPDDYDGYTYGDFDVALYHEDADGDDLDGDEKVALLIGGDVEGDVTFDGIDEDEYTFDFNVTDTEASDSVDVEVTESDATADFDQSVYSQTAGDIIHVNVDLEDTDDAYLQFGDEDSGYVDFIYIEDDSDNGEVDLTLNTRLMGTGHDHAVFSDDDDVVSLVDHADEDARDTDSANVGGAFSGLVLYEDEVDDDETISFNEYLDELDLADDEEGAAFDQLVRPLQATDYPLRSADGHFVADDGEADVDNELDAATVDLTTPSVEEISTLVAPEDSADEHDLAELLGDDDEEATMTERTDIAEDDRLIVRAEASGIFGAMIALEEDEYDPLEDGFEPQTVHELNQLDGEGVTIEIEGDDRVGNQDPNYVDFENADDDDVIVFANNEEGELYIVVDTSSSNAFDRSYEDGDAFEAVIEYETDEDDRFYFAGDGWTGGAGDSAGDGDTDEAAFPYFAADSTESVSTEFEMVDRDVWFDNLDEDDNVQLETSDSAVVTGETNVAPGSEADIRITNAGDTDSFLHTVDAEINSDGDFESEEVDFSERDEDDEAELDFRVYGSSVDDADGIFVEELVDDGDDAPADDGADDTADDDGTDDDAPADDGVDEPADDGVDEPTDDDEDGVPGFGLAVAVVALLAAAMLALRRQ
ncbi:BGTF surface domain-containing protein [Natrarchaeobaculum aegyptiacum]|uniref:PGF-CTERM archaeal protein-sorting signal domain-containing protein n=1 Tax=Natrarchaeobaculum aegyptiacum TaxID=745377 RepID=A0A2Z2HXT4_9EURY|nr:BGTF surface domain-containing protein [Natrarchaeobaculum aegyptiacum]ARS91713.1 hypothetical protein B1756_06490 [Natrarchaeobaculum aegyptiacum]